MFKLFRKTRKHDTEISDAVFRLSTRNASMDPDAFVSRAEKAVSYYLRALYDQNISLMPCNLIDEDFYNTSRDMIFRDASAVRRRMVRMEIEKSCFSGYTNDRLNVRSLSYDIYYQLDSLFSTDGIQWLPSSEKRHGIFSFINDSRLGFVLSGYTDMGVYH